MASFSQPPFFSSLIPIKKKTLAFSPQPNSFTAFKNSKISSSKSESSPTSQENLPESLIPEQDPIKLVFAEAKTYRSSTQSSNLTPKIVQSPLQESYAETSANNDDGNELKNVDVEKEVPLAVRIAMEKAKAYKKTKSLEKSVEAAKRIVQNLGTESAEFGKTNDGLKPDEGNDDGEKEVPLAVKIAMEKAKVYRKTKSLEKSVEAVSKIVQNLRTESVEIGKKNDGLKPEEDNNDGEEEVPLAVKLAFEKAKEYKKNKGLQGGNEESLSDKESIKNSDKEELPISSIDFMDPDFSDKKSDRGLPAGLVPQPEPSPQGETLEVEILVGDQSKFGNKPAAPNPIPIEEDNVDLYKPKVSTWGV